MRSLNGLEPLDVIPLQERKKQIQSVKNQFNKLKAVMFGQDFMKWIVCNIPENLANDFADWRDKEVCDKKLFVKSMIYFLAKYKDINIHKVNFKPSDSKSRDIIGGNTDGNFTFYNALFDTQDIAEVMGYLAHEMIHAFQDNGKSTLSIELNEICKTYYVNSEEDEELYRLNPKEQEADAIENIIKQGIEQNFRTATSNDMMWLHNNVGRDR